MVEKKGPPKAPGKGPPKAGYASGVAKPRKPPSGSSSMSDARPAARPSRQANDPLYQQLHVDLLQALKHARDGLRTHGTDHVSPARSATEIMAFLTKEAGGVKHDFTAHHPTFASRYGLLKSILAGISEGVQVTLPGLPDRADVRSEIGAMLAQHAELGRIELDRRATPDLPASGPDVVQPAADPFASINPALFGGMKMPNPADKPQPWRRNVPLGPQMYIPDDYVPVETQEGGGAGGPPPSDTPLTPFTQDGPEKRPEGGKDLAPSDHEMALTDKAREWVVDRLIRNRRAIKRGAVFLGILSLLSAIALGPVNFAALVGGLIGVVVSSLTAWASYRLIAGAGALCMLLWIMEMTPTDMIPPPRNSLLPGLIGGIMLVFAITPDAIAASVSALFNSQLDPTWTHALLAMGGLGLLAVCILRYFDEYEDISQPPSPLPPQNRRGYGPYSRDAFEEQDYGTAAIGGSEHSLNNALSGNKGTFRPKFRD